jgi:hypothetical protein
MRRTVVLGVRTCTGLAAPNKHRSDGNVAPRRGLEQVVRNIGCIDVGQYQQIGVARQRAVRHHGRAAWPSSATSPCISPSTSSQGACWLQQFQGLPHLDCTGLVAAAEVGVSSAGGLWLEPKRIISSAAITVISVSSSGVGS